MIQYHCSSCGTLLEISDEFRGKPVACPSCDHVSRVSASSPTRLSNDAQPDGTGTTGESVIRCICPRCKSTLEVPERNAGKKGRCPSCGQRLRVPLPPPNKTLLAPLAPPDPPGDPMNNSPSRPTTRPGPDSVDHTGTQPRGPHHHSPAQMYSTLFLGLGILFSVFAVLVPVLISAAAGPSHGTTTAMSVVFWTTGSIAAVLFILMWVMNEWKKNECPSCRRWGKQNVGRTLLDKRRGFRTRTRADSQGVVLWGGGHHSHQNVYGTGVTYRDEQVRVMGFIYTDHYECRFCGDRWDKIKKEETENFDL